MGKRDYYEVLGVSRDAGPEALEKSFRKLAIRYHPDRNPDGREEAEAKFKEAAEAYDVLRDPEKRRLYDQYGHAGLSGAHVRGFSGFDDIFATFSDLFGGGSLFEDFFGGPRSRRRAGPDRRVQVELTFEEVVAGVEKTVQFTRNEYCEECGGSGARRGTRPVACPYCHGRGRVQHRQGFMVLQETCPQCRGTGAVIQEACPRCGGSGRVPKPVRIAIKMPPGVPDGQRFIVRREGDPGENGAPRGDLYCDVRVRPHSIFEREGDDIVCELPIGFAQAALGGELEVPTLRGRASLRIPRGTQSGKVLRLAAEGFPMITGRGRGDQLVRIVIETPKRLTPRQEQLLREFAETEDQNVSPRRKSFFERVKRYFEGL